MMSNSVLVTLVITKLVAEDVPNRTLAVPGKSNAGNHHRSTASRTTRA